MPDAIRKNRGTTVAFGDVVQLSKVRSKGPEADGFERYVGLENLEPGELQIRNWGDIADGTTFTSVFRPGQVLFGKRRAYQRKVAVADFSGVCSGDIYVLEPKGDNLLPGLLPFICQTDAFFDHAVGTSAGSLSPRTNWKSLSTFEFALPPLEEQRRMAQVLQATSRLRESLHLSLHAAETLLRSAVDAAAIQAVNSKAVLPLADLIESDRPICYGILMPGNGFEGGVPVIKVKDYPDGEIIEHGLLLTDPAIDSEYERSRLRVGDLLISIRGTIGRLAFVPESLDGANITQDTARLSLRSDNDTLYIRAMLESTFAQRQIAAFTTGLAVKGINIGELRRIQVPIVSFDEQHELVREVGEVRTAIQSLTARRRQAGSVLKAAVEELVGGSK